MSIFCFRLLLLVVSCIFEVVKAGRRGYHYKNLYHVKKKSFFSYRGRCRFVLRYCLYRISSKGYYQRYKLF